MKKLFILMMAAMPLFYACKKSNGGDPGKDPDQLAAAKKLQNDVTGKWLMGNISLTSPNAFHNGLVTRTSSFKHIGQKTRTGQGNVAVTGLDDPGTGGTNTGYIEFLSDSTYLIYDSEGHLFQGKFNAVTGDSISLGKFGSLGGIKLADNKLDFKLYYAAGSKTVVISGNKAPAITADSRTALLCRSWYLTNADYGSTIIGSTNEYYNESTQQYESFTVDSLSFVITTSGTYIVQEFEKGILKTADVANWKWHSSIANRFVYYWDDQPVNEDEDYILIRENTTGVLKLSEFYDDNGDNIVDEFKYLLLPAN